MRAAHFFATAYRAPVATNSCSGFPQLCSHDIHNSCGKARRVLPRVLRISSSWRIDHQSQQTVAMVFHSFVRMTSTAAVEKARCVRPCVLRISSSWRIDRQSQQTVAVVFHSFVRTTSTAAVENANSAEQNIITMYQVIVG